MNLSLSATLLGLLFVLTARSQKSAAGYYVSTNNDTVRGAFKNFKDWVINPAKVVFVSKKDNLSTTLTPDNCRYFHIDGGDAYEAYRVSRLTNELSDFGIADTISQYETITVFLRYAYNNGSYQLLEYNNGRRLNYYFKDGGNAPEELLYKAVKTDTSFFEDAGFRRQLLKYLAKEPAMKNREAMAKLQDLSYNSESLVAFLKYVAGAGIENNHRKNKPARLRLLAGYALSRLQATPGANESSLPAEDKERNFNSSSSPVAGLGLTLYQKRGLGKNFISFSVQGYSFKHTSQATVALLGITKNIKQSATIMEINIMPGRNIAEVNNLSWYLALPFSANLMLNSQEEAERFNTSLSINEKTITGNGTTRYTFSIQTGVLFKRMIGIWARYKFKTEFRGTQTYVNGHTSLQAGIEFMFGK